jgi:hypothetical protein
MINSNQFKLKAESPPSINDNTEAYKGRGSKSPSELDRDELSAARFDRIIPKKGPAICIGEAWENAEGPGQERKKISE